MEVGATSVGKGTDKIESSTSHSTASSETNMQHTSNKLQESLVSSRLSSLLSSLVAEPLAAAPRMPQQHSPRSANVGEKASLPQPLTTQPSFPVPPHIMGRNVNNPSEDLVAHGRRLQKPRLGVRVPYRNLTSQIVTQDELAQELFERSLKRHPVRDVPEGGDIFFAIKLTQRLANHLSPGSAQVSSVEENAGNSSQMLSQRSPDPNHNISSRLSSTTGTPAIADNKDLIAILEGDGDSDWIPTQPSSAVRATTVTSVTSVEPVPPPSIPHITNVKLDPVLEKELALKQLMEFQNNSRRRKSDKGQKTGEKPRRQKKQGMKEPLNKENGAVDLKSGKVNQANSQKNSKSSDVKNSCVSNNISQSPSVLTKGTRKRKQEDGSSVVAKRPRVSGKKSVIQSKSNVIKTVEKIQKKVRTSKSSSPNNNNNNNNNSTVMIVGSPAKMKGVAATNLKSTKTNLENKPKKSVSPSGSGKVPSVDSRKKPVGSLEGNHLNSSTKVDINLNKSDSQTPNQDSSFAHCTSIIDDFPEFPRSFTTPIRTYSPKKRTSNTVVSPKVQSPEAQPVSNVDTNEEKISQTEPKVSEDVKTSESSAVSSKQSPDSAVRKKKDSKENLDSKKRRMREVDRLLMDEGAINLLYEAERGESRRRSNAPDESESAPLLQRRILKSVRRKKKDLLLKTRLVKNAVLRLSNSSTTTVALSSARVTRSTDPPTGQPIPIDQGSEPLRKLSLDSRDSLRSPLPLTPVDPPSPQSFIYPARLPLPAEASRIIRRHSSSSNFSSRSASPNPNRICDMTQSADNSEKTIEIQKTTVAAEPSGSAVKSNGPSSSRRKKGVPIFIRKPQVIQTYQGKKKRVPPLEQRNSVSNVPVKQSHKASLQNKDLKTASKVLPAAAQKLTVDRKKVAIKKISVSEKIKLKSEMTKNFQKGFQSGKSSVKKTAENGTAKSKKKDEISKEKSSKSSVSTVDEMSDLTSCLAAAASAFAAEAREEKSSKKTTGSSGTSYTSSPCPSRSSKSPTPTNRTNKKEPRIAPPLSPNAATYSNLLKTLENESHKQRKKDGEEVQKQRSSVRQNAGTYHYKDISLRRYDNLVQVILTPQSTKMKNAMNLQVLRELKDALSQLKKDETCRAVLLTSTGSTFCQGIDFFSLLHTNAERRKSAAQELAQALKDFMKCLALFNKPIVAGVHGAAVGLGVTMLPFFDMVFASDKATFYTPYAKLGQVPEGAAILTLPHMFGNAVTSELLFGCRKLTASEALHFGLVTRILWPDRFQEELIPVIRGMANQSSQSMEATKALLRHSLRTKLDAALESENHLLVQHWISAECQTSFRKFLDDEDVGLQKQRVEA